MSLEEVRSRTIDAIRYGGLGTFDAEALVDALIQRIRQEELRAAFIHVIGDREKACKIIDNLAKSLWEIFAQEMQGHDCHDCIGFLDDHHDCGKCETIEIHTKFRRQSNEQSRGTASKGCSVFRY